MKLLMVKGPAGIGYIVDYGDDGRSRICRTVEDALTDPVHHNILPKHINNPLASYDIPSKCYDEVISLYPELLL